tara:strand:+ start:824 stop:979 length:156 start_codon:yes stop_codon:yes gene_type:complete
MDNYTHFLWSFYTNDELRKIIKSGSTLKAHIEEAKAELRNREQSQDEILEL